MLKYGKATQGAIAAMSRLAEVYDEGKTRLSSRDIAENRNLPRPLMAKLLTILSQDGLIRGLPGPGGGYALARHPRQITLYDIAILFERTNAKRTCPSGPGWCGHGRPCPLHYSLLAVDEQMVNFLKTTSLDVFRQPPDKHGVARASRAHKHEAK
jgi:Rrf2 family protein